MYTGTLINELMAVVERTEREFARSTEEQELRTLDAMYGQAMSQEPVLIGAA
jgi:hypothetical protein